MGAVAPGALAIAMFAASQAACFSGREAASELPKGPRRPDGVALDPVTIAPEPRAEAPARGIVALRTPLGTDVALATVEELFRRILAKDEDGIARLFTRDATVINPSAGSGASNAVRWWDQRIARLDYSRLVGEPIFRAEGAEIVRGDAPPPAFVSPAIRAESLSEEEVAIRGAIATTHAGADRLFGDEIIFWLRRDGERYKIYRMLEDFQFN